jgi:L-amino acid N-acyltransferase YncA
MSEEVRLVSISKENLNEYPEVVCFINPKNQYFGQKIAWIRQRLDEGLRIKLLYVPEKKRAAGFIEYIPGEFAWRAVSAYRYMFIHCLYVYPNENKNKGLGKLLIDCCIEDALKNSFKGVAAVASKGAFMANSSIFLKNGFRPIETDNSGNELLVYSFEKDELHEASINHCRSDQYQGLHIIYTKQCPWVSRMIEEVISSDLANRLNIQVTELTTAQQAQHAPSLYTTFNLIYNGRLLADRYISLTRFNNILKKEKLI